MACHPFAEPRWRRVAVLLGVFWLVAATASVAAPPSSEVETLKTEIAALRREYERRLADLEARLATLEAGAAVPPAAAPPVDQLARLREAARAAAGTAPAAAAPAATAPAPSGGRLSLNRLNPEVSFTGNVLGVAGDAEREDFTLQEVELDLQASLDPFSKSRITVTLADGEADVEEGYVVYDSLPGGLSLTAGKFRQQFGVLNRQHLHALPQTDFPAVLKAFFDDEGLAETGLSLRWLIPRAWASANELTVEVTDGAAAAFGGEAFRHPVGLAHLKSFWELGDAAYFEWGLSGAVGSTATGGASRVWGSDFTYHWQPPQRAKYRELTWRTELLLSERDDALGVTRDAWGGYSYLEGLLAQNLYLGMRFDRLDDPLEPSRHRWGVVPYLTWWQSEFVRLRAELQHLEDEGLDRDENRLLFQLTWAAGPHKHETY